MNTFPPPVTRPYAGLSWPLLVGGCVFVWLVFQPALLNDGDTYWHIAAGRWMFEHDAVPTTDPFSHTARGAPWMAHEWLAEILFAAAYVVGGWGAVVALASAAYATTFAVLARYFLRHLEPVRVLFFVAMALGLAAPHMLARPHALTMPLLAFWSVFLLRAREAERTPSLWLTPFVAAWANLHGSFPLALVLAAVFAVEGVLLASPSARLKSAKAWAVFLVFAFAASLLTPHGWNGWRFVADLHGMSFSLNTISEWRSPDFHRWQALEICLLIFAALVLLAGLRLPPVRIALLLGLLHLALKHARHSELLGMLAPLIVAHPFSTQWRQLDKSEAHVATLDRFFAALAPPAGRLATIAVLIALGLIALGITRADSLRPTSAMTPDKALEAVRAAHVEGPVFNAYEFGGYLIFSGVPPYVDARTDPYGDAFIEEHFRAVTLNPPDVLPRLLDRYQIEWTLLQPELPAVGLLDQLPGWRRLYSDRIAIVHVRERTAGPWLRR